MAITMALLPLKRLVTLYMYVVSTAMLLGAHYLSRVYVEAERSAKGPESVFEDIDCVQRLGAHVAAQCFIGATVGYLINLKQWAKLSMLVYTAPMVARLFGYPVIDLYRVHNISAMVMLLIIIFYIFHHLPSVFDLLKSGINHVLMAVQLYGWVPYIVAMWFKVLLPVQFVTFWLVLFGLQLLKYFHAHNHPIFTEGWIVVLLASISECCTTPISLTGLCFTVSYAAYLILACTKIYLTGRGGFLHDNVMHQGWTEGFTMFLLSIQTKITELKVPQRAFLMSIVLFIVCSSLIQSMYEIAEPFLLELSASQNKSISKHIRAVVLCTFLWMFPMYMTFCICQYFDLDFWLLVVISSCILTSVQVLGSLAVYILFIYDSVTQDPWESLDDVVYYAKGTTRVLEFIVAVFVVAYGLKESMLGEWSWINSSILLIHCYFNVWQRLQAGWKSYLLRREAVRRIESMPEATPEQLREHNDLCPICFQELLTARVTPCKHFFHALCLRKWLYVQESCPLCHQTINVPDDPEGSSSGSDPSNEQNQAGEQVPREDPFPGTGSNLGASSARGENARPSEQFPEQTEHFYSEEGFPKARGSPQIAEECPAEGDSSEPKEFIDTVHESGDGLGVRGTPDGSIAHTVTGPGQGDEGLSGHSRSSSHSTEENYIIVDTRQVEGEMEDERKAKVFPTPSNAM